MSDGKIIDPEASNAALDQLQFIRSMIPENVYLIPRQLIESVKGQLYTPDQFYKYQIEQAKIQSPYNLLYLLATPQREVVGYLWAELSQFDHSLFVNTFSISKDYWFKGQAIPLVVEFLELIKEKYTSPRVFWITVNPKFFEKHGFRRSKNVLMEYADN